jgi:small subunit ribosomal protein S21
MVTVKKKPGESEDKLISRFKQKVLRSGVLEEVRKRARFISKSEKRKEQKDRVKHSIKIKKEREKRF